MASLVLIPDVQEFISQYNDKFQITEIEVHNSIPLGQLNLWQQTGCTVLGVKLLSGKYHRNPASAYVTTPGKDYYSWEAASGFGMPCCYWDRKKLNVK